MVAYKAHRASVLACSAALALLPASTAEAAAPIMLLAPDKPKVDVRLGPVGKGRREAQRTLVLRNTSKVDRRLVTRFVPADGRAGQAVRRPGAVRGALVSFARADAKPVLAPLATTELALKFSLPDGQRLDRLSGALIVEARPTTRRAKRPPAAAVEPLVIAVNAALEPLADVVARPAKVELQTTEYLWGKWFTGRDAVVSLSGVRAQRALAEDGTLSGRSVLRNASGHSATVGWKVLERDGEHRAAVHVEGEPEAGKYSGPLALSAQSDQPRVELTVRAHHWIGWAIVAVIAGALIGGLLPHLGNLTRRKNVLRANVRGALERYETERDKRVHPLSYDLDELLGPKPWETTEWLAIPSLHGVAGLFSSIHWARSEADLDEDSEWALSLVTSIQRWVRVEEQTAQLHDTADQQHPADLDAVAWAATSTYLDSERLLIEARDPPVDDDAAEKFLARLQRQRDWHEEVADLWRLIMDVDDPSTRARLAAELRHLTEPDKREADRDDDARIDLIARAEQLKREIPLQGPRLLAASAAAATVASRRPGVLARAMSVGKATLDAPTIVNIRQLLSGQAKAAYQQAVPGAPAPQNARGLLQRISRDSLLLTALLVVGAVVGYVVPLYTDTWGSAKDYITAFAAGFGTQAIVQWGLLPVFASLRARRTAKAPAG